MTGGLSGVRGKRLGVLQRAISTVEMGSHPENERRGRRKMSESDAMF